MVNDVKSNGEMVASGTRRLGTREAARLGFTGSPKRDCEVMGLWEWRGIGDGEVDSILRDREIEAAKRRN